MFRPSEICEVIQKPTNDLISKSVKHKLQGKGTAMRTFQRQSPEAQKIRTS